MASPIHQKKWEIKFLSIWSNLPLSAYGIEWIFFPNPHHVSFSVFNLNYLFSKSVFSAVFPPAHSQNNLRKAPRSSWAAY